MKKEPFNPLPPEIQTEIDALVALEEPIRTDLIPEATGDWSEARRGLFYRPIEEQITLRLDTDVINWFKTHATSEEGYQTGINRALREYVARQHGSTFETR